MAISTADFKNGMCIMYNNKMCTIIEFQHVKPGKGGAFVRMKLRDIKTGRVLSDTVNAGVKFDTVRLEQFLDLFFCEGFYFLPVAVLHAADGKFTHFLRKGPSVFLEIGTNICRHGFPCVQSFSVHRLRY